MIDLSNDFKEKVIDALLKVRENYDGSDKDFSKSYGIDNTVFSRLKKGEREGLLKEAKYIEIGGKLNVFVNERKWNLARTDVFNAIEEEVQFCKEFSKGKIFIDNCGIGKTFTAQYLSRTLKNCFYIDAKQCKSKQLFIRTIAKTIGADEHGKYADVKSKLKYLLHVLQNPIIIIDDAGYLNYDSYLDLIEIVDATTNICGWYMIGDDSLQEKVERGINSKKVGFKAMFSRFSNRYSTVVPVNREEKIKFYKKLLTDVISVNISNKDDIKNIVLRCLRADNDTIFGDLRRAESLLILHS